MQYTITSRTSGHTLGSYEGTTPEAALDSMYHDAGYHDIAEYLADHPSDDGEYTISGTSILIS